MTSCLPCTQAFCSTCNSTTCTLCVSTYYLYSGTCTQVCPDGTFIQGSICALCPNGCKTCLSLSVCTSCFSTYLAQSDQCVTSCTPPLINYNASSCVSQCPINYYNNSGRC